MGDKLFGKYRGVVINNIDPNQEGRIQAKVPDVAGEQALNWALPCVPTNLPTETGSALPQIGAEVWIEFEAGDVDRPVWTGCFWTGSDMPPSLRNE
jgi:type VI secretion system (T6SS) baseplate-like injector VgrG